MQDPTDYENLFSKRRVRDIYAGSLLPVKLNMRQAMTSLLPFHDSIPSPAEFQVILDRTTPIVRDDELVVTATPMEIEGPE